MFDSIDAWVQELGKSSGVDQTRPALYDGVQRLGQLRAACDAAEARLAVAIDHLPDSGADAATVLRSATKCSEREAKRRATRATGLDSMPMVAEAFGSGRFGAEAADALVKAAAATSPAVVDNDHDLLRSTSSRPADLAARDARDWTQQHQSVAKREQVLRRQIKARQASWFEGDDNMGVLHARLDPVSATRMRRVLDAETGRLWRHDGGRDVSPDDVRNAAQRRADALMLLLTGRTGRRDDPAPSSHGHRRVVQDSLVIVADIGVVDGTNPDGRCEIIDAGPVPPSILDSLSPNTVIRGALFDGPGKPLWLGRKQRLASVEQRLMMSIRDGDCRHCDAPTWRCHAHHNQGWSQDQGRTDIDEMTLVCPRGHTQVHEGTVVLDQVKSGSNGGSATASGRSP